MSDAPHQELVQIVLEALSHDPDWAAADATNVTVKEVSKGGAKRGAFVFKVTSPDGAAVALRHGPSVQRDQFLNRKTETATLLFSEAGLSPPRLATGDNWFIEAWWPAEEPTDWTESVEKWKEYGRLTAKVHLLPTSWFEPYQREILKENPWATNILIGSRVWMYLSCPCQVAEKHGLRFLEENPDFCRAYADLGPLMPRHPLAARIVTVHNDHHPLNILDLGNGGGLRIIDLETASVDYPIGDISCAVMCAAGDVPKTRAFLEGYLEGSGHAVSEEDITALLLDAYVFAVFAVRIWLSPPGFLGLTEQEAKERLGRWKAYAEAVRTSETEQKELLEMGPEKSFARMGLIPSE